MASENSNNTARGGIGICGLALLWGLITQALAWAGVIDWPWYAMWGPVLIAVGISLVVFFVVFVLALVLVAADR